MPRPSPLARRDPLEASIEDALAFGEFIPWNAVDSFVERLHELVLELTELIATDPARASSLLELFLAGCYEKAEELDDDRCATETLVQELFCAWVQARQAGGADPDGVAAWLLARMSDDPYGFTHDLDRELVKVMNAATCDAFARQVRARHAAHAGPLRRRGDSRPWAEVLRTVYAHRADAGAYAALCAETETSAEDCAAMASMLRAGTPADALTWVDRGLQIAAPATTTYVAQQLVTMRRELLAEMGHAGAALDDAWQEFASAPSASAFTELMRFAPTTERATWRTKALDAAPGVPLETAIDLLLEADDVDRLAARIAATTDPELEAIGHYRNGRLAERLDEPRPAIAARVYRALGMRVATSKKSKYYDAAIRNFADARRCYEAAGQGAAWAAVVAEVRREHGRKWKLINAFEHVVATGRPFAPPSLLDRARARWST